ncbi:MAG: Mo-dependent nitrogenase C-terminal domain-containing protein [Oculatellaceae cyanobacterium bins.114]|nr:Mo-dependent nitrogenase C-terminal domain-containing protein [Oculatellaceae cyanobacterium bins.114]
MHISGEAMLHLLKPVLLLTQPSPSRIPVFDGLRPIRQWLNGIEINNGAIAHFICQTIPAQCPFERDICLLGRISVHIPPLTSCGLSPDPRLL